MRIRFVLVQNPRFTAPAPVETGPRSIATPADRGNTSRVLRCPCLPCRGPTRSWHGRYPLRCTPTPNPHRGADHNVRSPDDARACAPIGAKSPRDPDFHAARRARSGRGNRKSTRLNSSHGYISYAVFCLKKKKKKKKKGIAKYKNTAANK